MNVHSKLTRDQITPFQVEAKAEVPVTGQTAEGKALKFAVAQILRMKNQQFPLKCQSDKNKLSARYVCHKHIRCNSFVILNFK